MSLMGKILDYLEKTEFQERQEFLFFTLLCR